MLMVWVVQQAKASSSEDRMHCIAASCSPCTVQACSGFLTGTMSIYSRVASCAAASVATSIAVVLLGWVSLCCFALPEMRQKFREHPNALEIPQPPFLHEHPEPHARARDSAS